MRGSSCRKKPTAGEIREGKDREMRLKARCLCSRGPGATSPSIPTLALMTKTRFLMWDHLFRPRPPCRARLHHREIRPGRPSAGGQNCFLVGKDTHTHTHKRTHTRILCQCVSAVLLKASLGWTRLADMRSKGRLGNSFNSFWKKFHCFLWKCILKSDII